MKDVVKSSGNAEQRALLDAIELGKWEGRAKRSA